jgi:hypothetical protein
VKRLRIIRAPETGNLGYYDVTLSLLQLWGAAAADDDVALFVRTGRAIGANRPNLRLAGAAHRAVNLTRGVARIVCCKLYVN